MQAECDVPSVAQSAPAVHWFGADAPSFHADPREALFRYVIATEADETSVFPRPGTCCTAAPPTTAGPFAQPGAASHRHAALPSLGGSVSPATESGGYGNGWRSRPGRWWPGRRGGRAVRRSNSGEGHSGPSTGPSPAARHPRRRRHPTLLEEPDEAHPHPPWPRGAGRRGGLLGRRADAAGRPRRRHRPLLSAAPGTGVDGEYIVVLKDGANPRSVAGHRGRRPAPRVHRRAQRLQRHAQPGPA